MARPPDSGKGSPARRDSQKTSTKPMRAPHARARAIWRAATGCSATLGLVLCSLMLPLAMQQAPEALALELGDHDVVEHDVALVGDARDARPAADRRLVAARPDGEVVEVALEGARQLADGELLRAHGDGDRGGGDAVAGGRHEVHPRVHDAARVGAGAQELDVLARG